ncbi:MAG: hypothetical protein M1833_002025 [Piccolia ochrophora]|nr:MAG: hypothetical protein M1833_002025 [Piccolia ochrophora]
MGLLSRRQPVDGAPATTTATDHNGHHTKERAHNHHGASGDLNSRPSFGQWLKATWLDIVTMIIMGAVGLGVYMARPAPTRSFAIYLQDGEIVYPEFAYPLRNEVIPIWAAAMLAALVPITVFLICQIRIRSFWDVNNATIGLLYSLITAAVFQVFVKWLIGGLRPHFLSVCKPNVLPDGREAGNGFRQIYYDRSICTGDDKEINDALESMPSGHTTAAFAGFVFLYLYLNAKLKVFSNYHPAMWKLIAIYAPILGAVLIGGALTIDEFHNWYDILAGALIGTTFAFSAYRMVYASVWDFRFNHIPLTRHVPFSYGAGPAGAGGFERAVWTRKAEWGHLEGAFGGAPFDAGVAMRGGGGGGIGGGGAQHVRNGSGQMHGHGHGHGHGGGIERRPVGGDAIV